MRIIIVSFIVQFFPRECDDFYFLNLKLIMALYIFINIAMIVCKFQV